MHLAAESHVDRSIDAPSAFIQSNIIGTYELLEASRNYWIKQGQPIDFRFHHISTDEVYGTIPVGSWDENSPIDPRSPYSASKASAEFFCLAYRNTHQLHITITRSANNFGPKQSAEKLIPTIIKSILNGKPIPVYGNGQNVRDWLYVQDHVDVIDMIFHKGKIGETLSKSIAGDCVKSCNVSLSECVN